ncbi:hypothetical protein ARAM_001452 [Aspergillus rambellii]|uniref:Amino acid permease/ SLC12A domain-containing protein n=2 Tax=Aspergillus subgen. Nidulantes TaxID=2720870 RepID=A0A0F8V4J9_9EURO|nr:hypothetical protein AOCH_002233 [Aspergillus ochraceoroseus]KKK26704.1 hypothetical protein ARAM_001452 [Aspergillus rambellii]
MSQHESSGYHSSTLPNTESNPESNPGNAKAEHETQISTYGALKPYQLTVIAIGGSINTGLMIAFGNALSRSGPASILISHTFVGLIVFLVLCALGEVASSSSEPSTVPSHAVQFCGPSLGFTLGWIYWLKYMVVIPNQLTAGTMLVKFWRDLRSGETAAYITIFLAIIIGVNYKFSRLLSRFEFFLSSFKVIVVVGLIILSLVLVLGGGPDHQRKGFRYWKRPGAFANVDNKTAMGIIYAVFRAVPSTTFSYLGTELLGMSLLHTQSPRKAAARAVKQTFYRILAFNVLFVTLLGMAIPYDEDSLALTKDNPKSAASAFVVAVQLAHISTVPHILNAFILVFVLSAASRALCMATRILYELSLDKNAPSFLSHTDNKGVPVYALGVCSVSASLTYLNISNAPGILWTYFVNMVTMFNTLTWTSILIVHIAFVRACKIHHIDGLPFKAPFGVIGSSIALVCCLLMPIMRGIELSEPNSTNPNIGAIVTSFLGIPLYFSLVLGYKAVAKKKMPPIKAYPWANPNTQSVHDTAPGGTEQINNPPTQENTPWQDRAIPVWLI